MIPTIFFYLLAAFILFSAYFVVTARNLFRGAVGLVAVLLGVAGMYLLLDAQFLSAVQVTVYVGGVVVLIVFAILLIADVTQKTFRVGAGWRKVTAGLVVLAGLAGLIAALAVTDFGTTAVRQSASVRDLGRALISAESGGFLLPFEALSLLLVAALVGAVTVARPIEKERQTKDLT